MGEIQIDLLKRMISDRFAINCELDAGKILYKEKIAARTVGVGHFEPLRHYAEVQLLIEPQPKGTGLVFDYNNVFLIDCADVFSPKSIRGGMSGQFMLNFFEMSEQEFLTEYGDRHIVCADMNGQNVFEFDCPDEHILILGNEGQGVSENLSKVAKSTVMIPMKNNLESLNVAVSGGIIMYQLSRKQWR